MLDGDWELVGNKTGATRLGFSLILKFFEQEARFPRHVGELPKAAVDYVAGQVKVDPALLVDYDWSGRSIERHRAVKISPHNPSGPISTIASMHVCLATPSLELLEYQWGEVPEREKMITPGEGFDRGWLVPSGKAGLGVALDHEGLAAHASSVTKLVG